MANFNRIILAGNLTRDPELSHTSSSIPVCKFGLAVNRQWTDRETNAKREETMFVDCTAWRRTAEVINQYLQKDSHRRPAGPRNLDDTRGSETQQAQRPSGHVSVYRRAGWWRRGRSRPELRILSRRTGCPAGAEGRPVLSREQVKRWNCY